MESRGQKSHSSTTLKVVKKAFDFVTWEETYHPADCVVSTLLSEMNANAALEKILKKIPENKEFYRRIFWIKQSNTDRESYRIVVHSENFNKLSYYEDICGFLNKVHSFKPFCWKIFLTNDTAPKYRLCFTIPTVLHESEELIAKFKNFSEEKFPNLSEKIKKMVVEQREKNVVHFKILDPVLLNEIQHLFVEDFNRTLSIKP